MAMNKDTLGALMKSKTEAVGIAAGAPMTDAQKLAYYVALADAVISHIQGSAQVNAGIHVTVSTGSGLGATDAPGTIT